jgi:acyl-ACP thioesterase
MTGILSHVNLVPRPPTGRVFTQSRRVHLGDVSPGGRLRLDAMARYLQDISNEDTRASGLSEVMSWVVRRTVIDVEQPAVLGEVLELTTWCSGTGSRWAERRVSLAGERGALIETATLWVHVDLSSGRPVRLPDEFLGLFGEAAGGRTVRARLTLGGPPASGDSGDDMVARPWPLRFADFDVLGHVNNAAYWEAVEEELAGRRELRAPLRATLEFVREIDRGTEISVVVANGPDQLDLWLVSAAGVHAVARVERRPSLELPVDT